MSPNPRKPKKTGPRFEGLGTKEIVSSYESLVQSRKAALMAAAPEFPHAKTLRTQLLALRKERKD